MEEKTAVREDALIVPPRPVTSDMLLGFCVPTYKRLHTGTKTTYTYMKLQGDFFFEGQKVNSNCDTMKHITCGKK